MGMGSWTDSDELSMEPACYAGRNSRIHAHHPTLAHESDPMAKSDRRQNMPLDDKQHRLINAWLGRASAIDGDEYSGFMSAWIAFNAFCCAKFASSAMKPRADLRKNIDLTKINDPVDVGGKMERRSDGKVQIRINTPCVIKIDIKERYTEDLVFNQFASNYENNYGEWLKNKEFKIVFDKFLAAIQRDQGVYVINILRAAEHLPDISLDDMINKNVIVAIKDESDLRQIINVLYQVRCNVFHGEKVPGEVNDDRVVQVARPLIVELLNRAMSSTNESLLM